MDHARLTQIDQRHLWHPFTAMAAWCAPEHEPLLLTAGRGCRLLDQHGREYLDGNSSIWTNIHGHNHPAINAAIRAQLDRVAHTSFLGFTHEPGIQLAEQLVGLLPNSGLSRVFYTDNGSTAIESAVRMALQFWRQTKQPQRRTLLAFDRAYHGDTLGAASLGGIPVFQAAPDPFGYDVIRIADLNQLELLSAEQRDGIAAAIIEPLIQGAAGMRLWPQGMLKDLESWCRQHGILLILDEVMTGFGRTGRMFACQHEDVAPDFLCLAKGLTGGYLPLAATLTTEHVFRAFLQPEHIFYYGHSYCGNQLGCAAALASLRVFREERVIDRVGALIPVFQRWLGELAALREVIEVRQCGLIGAVEVRPRPHEETAAGTGRLGARICVAARRHGLLTRPILDTIVLMPPLCVTESELEWMITALRQAIQEV